jgi:hypothetical protein
MSAGEAPTPVAGTPVAASGPAPAGAADASRPQGAPSASPVVRASFRRLDADRIVETAQLLSRRIRERFPNAGLAGVAEDLADVARGAAAAVREVQRPSTSLRLGIFALFAAIATSFVLAVAQLPLKTQMLREGNLPELIQTTEASIASIVFLGAAAAYLIGLEGRTKRARCLRRLHELRALAHVVDMHQLTKDPERLLRTVHDEVDPDPIHADTASSPRPALDAFLLGRYLDYCSEMMAVLSKIAALYAQASVDPAVIQSVDDIEALTTALSNKIWQKLMLLDQVEARVAAAEKAVGG